MAVKNWHFGKIVLLWVCGSLPPLVIWVIASVTRSLHVEALLVILVATLVSLSFLVPITWKWLSGKEKRY